MIQIKTYINMNVFNELLISFLVIDKTLDIDISVIMSMSSVLPMSQKK